MCICDVFISPTAGTRSIVGAYSIRSPLTEPAANIRKLKMKDGMQTTSGGSAYSPLLPPRCEEPEFDLNVEAREEQQRSTVIVNGAVSVTQHAGRPEKLYAPAGVRDQFLASLDGGDWITATAMAVNLTECANPLPSMTCSEFGLPIGSTYGAAAKYVLATNALERTKRG